MFNDLNGNGTLDNGEPGLGGVVVYLDLNNSGGFDPGELQHGDPQHDDPSTPVNEAGSASISPVWQPALTSCANSPRPGR